MALSFLNEVRGGVVFVLFCSCFVHRSELTGAPLKYGVFERIRKIEIKSQTAVDVGKAVKVFK